MLFNQFVLPKNAPLWAFWVMIGVSLLLGLVVGIVCCKIYRVGVFLLGSLFGAILGLILYSAVIAAFTSQMWVLILVVCLMAVACGFIAWYANIIGVIVSTSLIGAYLVVRASSWYIGGYPNEWTLYQQFKQMGISMWKTYWKFYIYLGVMLVFMVIGIIVQLKIKEKSEEDHELEEKFKYFRIGGATQS